MFTIYSCCWWYEYSNSDTHLLLSRLSTLLRWRSVDAFPLIVLFACGMWQFPSQTWWCVLWQWCSLIYWLKWVFVSTSLTITFDGVILTYRVSDVWLYRSMDALWMPCVETVAVHMSLSLAPRTPGAGSDHALTVAVHFPPFILIFRSLITSHDCVSSFCLIASVRSQFKETHKKTRMKNQMNG